MKSISTAFLWINKVKLRHSLSRPSRSDFVQSQFAEDIVKKIMKIIDQTGFGAFDDERIIGFATVSHRIFGSAARYVQLVCFQISEEYRYL